MPIDPAIHLSKLREAIRLIDAATDGVRHAIPRREDCQNDDAFQEARGKIHLLLGMLCEVRGDLHARAGAIPTEVSAGASTRPENIAADIAHHIAARGEAQH